MFSGTSSRTPTPASVWVHAARHTWVTSSSPSSFACPISFCSTSSWPFSCRSSRYVACYTLCCSVLQCVAVCCRSSSCRLSQFPRRMSKKTHAPPPFHPILPLQKQNWRNLESGAAVCCSVLQCVAVCCRSSRYLAWHTLCCTVLHCIAKKLTPPLSPHFNFKKRKIGGIWNLLGIHSESRVCQGISSVWRLTLSDTLHTCSRMRSRQARKSQVRGSTC